MDIKTIKRSEIRVRLLIDIAYLQDRLVDAVFPWRETLENNLARYQSTLASL